MITMKGKYNSANIMIDDIDQSTRDQIQTFLNHPAFSGPYIAIMPDCHAGAGAVIGFTMEMNDYIIPNLVGVDIGCGMLSVNFGKIKLNLEELDNFIKGNIPSGFNINSNYDHVELNLCYKVADVCERIGVNSAKALKAVGSLGGGNHFIEAGYDSNENLWTTVHSGSRNFGLKVANYYQKKAKENLEKYFIKDKYKNLEFLLTNSDDGRDYLHDLRTAQLFASSNRREIIQRITNFIEGSAINFIESVHNFIGRDGIIRKGATSAKEGEFVIIPFNMRDGIALCVGEGSQKYNYSAPHGAGRILSRKQAKAQLSEEDFISQMTDADIYTTTANAETLDEAPGAYKDMQIILDNIEETVRIIDFIKPIYNFKANN